MKLRKLNILAISAVLLIASCHDIDSSAGDDRIKGAPNNIPTDTLASGTNAAGMGPTEGRAATDTAAAATNASGTGTLSAGASATPVRNNTTSTGNISGGSTGVNQRATASRTDSTHMTGRKGK